MKWWCVIVTVAVAVSAVKAQDYYDDDFWDWRSNEDTLSNIDNDADALDTKKEEPFSDDANNDDYYSDKNEDDVMNPLDDQVSLDKDNEGLNKDDNLAIDSQINSDDYKDNEGTGVDGDKTLLESETNSNENVPIEDLRTEDKHIDTIVQEQIKQIQEDLDEPNSAISENVDDYQIEDNRSDKGDIPSKPIDNNLPGDDDGSFEIKDHDDPLQADPLDGFNVNLNDPGLGGDLDSIAINKEDSPAIHEIISDATKLLNKENSLFEEDIDNENKNQDDLETNKDKSISEPYNKENKNDNSDENEETIDVEDSLGELDENSQEDTAVEDMEKIIKSDKEDIHIENENVNQEPTNPKSLGDLDVDSQEDTNVEDLEQKDGDDMMYEDNKDLPEGPADNFDESFENEPRFSFVKYGNDMIKPEEVEETVNNSEDDSNSNSKNVEDTNISDEEEDTVDKAYKDLNADLEKLFATWDKLTSNDSSDEEEESGQVSDKKSGKDGMSSKESEEDSMLNKDDLERENTVLRDREELDKYIDKYGADDSLEDEPDSIQYYDDENIFAADTNVDISDEKEVPQKDVEDIVETKIGSTKTYPEETEKERDENTTSIVKTIDVIDLTTEQYNDIMTQFAIVHANELDTQADDFGKYIAAIHITLTAEESVEITSPNFPNTYPTNNVLDWILEGDGTGIELNITDLAIRGAQSDFLLVKPGGLDESGHEGLIFSYQLNEPRLYRFTDVNRVFVRFQSGPGLGFLKGFRMTVKNIWPPENQNSEEDLPEPEPLLPSPTATITVNLAGITVFDFIGIKPDFQRIIADMANMYINANGIDAGLNSTSETTQITSVSSCKANWPNFENCVAISFGVPLLYEDDEETGSRLNKTDLQDMWRTSVNRDPFAARLRAMGISEFDVPNDSRVILVWVVLAVGVVIATAMVAFALWRYSCFEDYTRMNSFSDTDSINNQKRGLDLYPTPHQNLPPLYADQDYKWADAKYDETTRVDLGGFTNRNFARDELVDIYSDEDTAVHRDRNAGIAPRKIYQV